MPHRAPSCTRLMLPPIVLLTVPAAIPDLLAFGTALCFLSIRATLSSAAKAILIALIRFVVDSTIGSRMIYKVTGVVSRINHKHCVLGYRSYREISLLCDLLHAVSTWLSVNSLGHQPPRSIKGLLFVDISPGNFELDDVWLRSRVGLKPSGCPCWPW